MNIEAQQRSLFVHHGDTSRGPSMIATTYQARKSITTSLPCQSQLINIPQNLLEGSKVNYSYIHSKNILCFQGQYSTGISTKRRRGGYHSGRTTTTKRLCKESAGNSNI
jgi:hypothetical protein